jgi:hypothetical protein
VRAPGRGDRRHRRRLGHAGEGASPGGRQVTVVTGDLCMQLRAGAIGLAEAVMPEKYSKDAQRRKNASEDEEPDASQVPAG